MSKFKFFFGTLFLRVMDCFELLMDSCLTVDLFLSEGPSLSERIDDYLLKSLFFAAISGDTLDYCLVRLACRLIMVVWIEFCLDDILKFDDDEC